MGILGGMAAGSALPRGVCAQQTGKIDRVGFLRMGPPPPSFIDPLRNGLRDLGYVEGRNLAFDYAIATQPEQLPKLAAELAARKPSVLIASGTPAVLPARNATATLPIIFIAAIDPVATGVVMNLAHPGGNITGLTAVFSDLTGKRLELLKEILPHLNRAALLSRPANPGHTQYVHQALMAARILRVELEILTANGPEDFEPAFIKAQAFGAGALIQIDDATYTFHRVRLVELSTKYRIPGAYGFREFTDLGGFLAVGPSYSDLYSRAAAYVDKILKGARPADLPVEQASRFEMIVNLKAAKALNLSISPNLLARADEVIE